MTTPDKIIGKHQQMKATVWSILQDNVRARNDDRWLILKVLEATGQDIVLGENSAVWHIDYEKFGQMPNFETIRRVRQEIQNTDGHFLPTDPKVLCERKFKEAVIRYYYANNPQIIQSWVQLAYEVH